ncbi:MAG TPA: FAD-dependent oxidoreductase [Syntrophales bacterium]|nr:FAD-dependent oxidoreductase [Syntrophales bacterium]
MSFKVLVIGGVACGPKAAARLKRLRPDAEITVIEKGKMISYGACGMPYYVEGVFSDIEALIKTPVGVPRTPAFFDKVKGVTVLTQMEALKIDTAKKAVRVKNLETGAEADMAYDKLVLATGGSPCRPNIPGLDLANVWFVSHPDHVVSLKKEIAAQGLKKAVLVGAGFIGIEMAEALVQQGLSVTLVEMCDQIMPGVLDDDIATFAAKHLRQKGVTIVLGERVTGIEGKGKAVAVRTVKQSIPADVVVVAVGTRPNDKLARDAGLDCAEQGGIVINEYCQTSNRDIYAGGDCAVNRYVNGSLGAFLYVPLGSTANKHGRTIANHIAGSPTPFSGIACTAIVRAFEYTLGRTGLTEKLARQLNMDVETFVLAGPDMPHYMPNNKPLVIKMIASKRDRRLIGVQVVGPGNGAKRLDVAAGMILMGATLDQLADVDFGYAPPFSTVLDPLAACAHMLTNKLDGIAKGISAFEAKKRIEKGDVVLLDVRTPDEFQTNQLPYDVLHIPLGAVRGKLAELPKDKDILTFCKISLRGYEAQRILNAAGFDRVQFIEGGIVGWPFEVRTLK